MKLQQQIANITEGADVVYSPYHSIKKNGTNSHYIIKDDIWAALMMSKIGITSSNLFRKEAVLSIDGWDETLSSSQDAALAFALLKNDAVFLPLDHVLTNIYATDFSITRTTDKNKIKSIINNYIELRKNILQFLKMKGIDDHKYQRIYRRVFADCYLWYFDIAPFYTWKEYNKNTKDNLIDRLKNNYSFFRKSIRK
jgi:hypothetical protein